MSAATERFSVQALLQPKLLLVSVLAATMTFEDFILKWLPVADPVYSASRFASELLIYGLFLYVVGVRLLTGRAVRRTPLDLALLAFLGIAAASILLNDAPVLGSLINLRVLIRYIALFYVVVNLDLEPRQVRSLLVLIVAVGVLQSLIGLLQAAQGGPGPFWLPRASDLEVAGYSKQFTVLTGGVEKGAVIGAFGHPVAMGLYLILAVVCALALLLESPTRSWIRNVAGWAAVLLMTGAVLLTYSRASLAALALVIPVMLWYARRRGMLRRLSYAGSAAAALMLAALAVSGGPAQVAFVKVKEQYVNPMQNIALLFSSEYWERTQGARQWVIREVGSSLLRQGSLLGFSPDEDTAKSEISKRAAGTLGKLVAYKAFEDVYWIAILAYYGLVGFGLFLFLLWRLHRQAIAGLRAALATSRSASLAFGTLLVVTIPLTLIVRTFEFRAFGFYFWLLAALMYTEVERVRATRPARLVPSIGSAQATASP